MWNKKYCVVDIDGNEDLVTDLAQFMMEFGLRKFLSQFGDDFEKRVISIDTPYDESRFWRFYDSEGFACKCRYILLNLDGKRIPYKQAVAEFVEAFPKNTETQRLLDSVYYWDRYVYGCGFKRSKRRRKGGVGNRVPKYNHYRMHKEFVEYDGLKVRMIRSKQKDFVSCITDWYSDYPWTNTQRNWKRFRKTQYK